MENMQNVGTKSAFTHNNNNNNNNNKQNAYLIFFKYSLIKNLKDKV